MILFSRAHRGIVKLCTYFNLQLMIISQYKDLATLFLYEVWEVWNNRNNIIFKKQELLSPTFAL